MINFATDLHNANLLSNKQVEGKEWRDGKGSEREKEGLRGEREERGDINGSKLTNWEERDRGNGHRGGGGRKRREGKGREGKGGEWDSQSISHSHWMTGIYEA